MFTPYTDRMSDARPPNPSDSPSGGPHAAASRHQPPDLHAPWRLEYLEGLKEGGTPVPSTGSFLLDYWLNPGADVANHVIVRTGAGMILLNGFPYSNGHLLIALGDPRPTLLDYAPAQRATLWSLTETATELLQRTLDPQGVNIGINQGRAAGAGIPQHLHVHLVPRWGGDINFMTVVGNVRVIPSSLAVMARKFRAVWAQMNAAPRGEDSAARENPPTDLTTKS